MHQTIEELKLGTYDNIATVWIILIVLFCYDLFLPHKLLSVAKILKLTVYLQFPILHCCMDLRQYLQCSVQYFDRQHQKRLSSVLSTCLLVEESLLCRLSTLKTELLISMPSLTSLWVWCAVRWTWWELCVMWVYDVYACFTEELCTVFWTRHI